jgi:hypothetical protein
MPATAPLTASPTPCDTGTPSNQGLRSGVFGNKVSWVIPSATNPYQLYQGTFTAGVCTASAPLFYGTATLGGTFSGLIDDQFVLVASNVNNNVATITLMKFGSGFTPLSVANVYFGAKAPYAFVMGPPRHAVVLSGDIPALISY